VFLPLLCHWLSPLSSELLYLKGFNQTLTVIAVHLLCSFLLSRLGLPSEELQTRLTWRFGAYQIPKSLVSGCSLKKWSSFNVYSEASKSTWRSPVYDHFDITLRRDVDVRGSPKGLSFVFTCKVNPAHHPAHTRPRMSTGHGTKNIQDGVKACNKRAGTVTDTTAVKSTGRPYSPAAHRALIAMRCAKNHRPFNSVLDEDYQAEVEMLRPGTVLPSPQTVSRDIKAMYAEMSKNVRNYFMVMQSFLRYVTAAILIKYT
jgi:hypothetical protein